MVGEVTHEFSLWVRLLGLGETQQLKSSQALFFQLFSPSVTFKHNNQDTLRIRGGLHTDS